jgi:predicted ATPase/class 3 adenylate cyclase/DNA-binding CsgD family transcriptional regulator
VNELPTGTVTLLLADVEGSTRLWETQPEEMTAAFAALDHALSDLVAAHHGVRPVEQGEGDSFVVAFARATDAVACALDLQRTPLAPILLRIGLHTGEIQLRDETNYIGPTINRTARIRDLAHGGQTVLSGTTEVLVVDALPAHAWLTDLGRHELRGVPRPERVVQLCHADLRNEFPPLRAPKPVVARHLPSQPTSFVGRQAEIDDVCLTLADSQLVTLTGAGGVGKTRLAVQVALQLAEKYADGVWYIDLAPITDPDMVPLAVIRALGLPDQPGRSTMDALLGFIGGRGMLVVLDNCEHLLDACATLAAAVLGSCPQVTLLATSREPIRAAGEVIWQVPSLSLTDEAIELFTERARRVKADFKCTDDNAAAVVEICRRLDGMPLAIELAAARVRALSLGEILDGLHDRFRLLTGGARTAVRRQQTLRASVDWSHALLTDPEQVLFRRLSVFLGGFDLDAAQMVAGGAELERYQALDELALLVDKSLVSAENDRGRTRYRLLETVRQYALEKLGESGEADAVRTRHRDYYTQLAAALDNPAGAGRRFSLTLAETEIDNLRAAFDWSHEKADTEFALALASSLQPLWITRGRIREGLAWLSAGFTQLEANRAEVAPAVRAQALADKVMLDGVFGNASVGQAEQSLAIAREIDDPRLLARALAAGGAAAAGDQEVAQPYLTEAIALARAVGDRWRLSQIIGWQAHVAFIAGDPSAARAMAEEGRDLAEAIGDQFVSRQCRWLLGWAQLWRGDLPTAAAQFAELVAEAEAAHDAIWRHSGLWSLGYVLAYRGDPAAARDVANAVLQFASRFGGRLMGSGYSALAIAALAGGDAVAARDAGEIWWRYSGDVRGQMAAHRGFNAQAALALGDLAAARRWVDNAEPGAKGWHLMLALTTCARVAIACGELERADHAAHEALACSAGIGAQLGLPDILECLAGLAADATSYQEATRLFAAADAIRRRTGEVRFKIYDADYEASITALRDTMGHNEFEDAWAQGAALSTDEAIAYAQRGRGECKRPTTGWASLTPTELDVVRLVSEGLPNKDIGARLFVSARTVETHLTHVYNKLGLASRAQLAQEAARHA